MWYVVVDVTNYGDGVYLGGIYRSLEKAEKRLAWLENHCGGEDDSWRIMETKSEPITAEIE